MIKPDKEWYPNKQRLKGFDYLDKWKNGDPQAGPSSPIGKIGPDVTTNDQLFAELQLMALGDIAPLKQEITESILIDQLSKYENDWVDYLPRQGWSNNRKGMLLVGPEGYKHTQGLSMPEIAKDKNNPGINEALLSYPTQLYKDLSCMHDVLDYYSPLGRTYLIKLNIGGWFPPHRDSIQIPRETFRLVAFFGKSGPHDFRWNTNYNQLSIENGRLYYIDTRKVHETFCNVGPSIHLIVNVPLTLENVYKVMNNLKNY